jgi:hypothetical protein
VSAPSHSDLEGRLTQFYSQQIGRYRSALEMVDQLPQRFAAGHHPEAELHQLRLLLEETERLDREWAPVKDEWRTLRQPPGPTLAAVLRDTERLIVQLMDYLTSAEQSAQRAKHRLLPQVSEVSRRQQMRAAYTSARDQR